MRHIGSISVEVTPAGGMRNSRKMISKDPNPVGIRCWEYKRCSGKHSWV